MSSTVDEGQSFGAVVKKSFDLWFKSFHVLWPLSAFVVLINSLPVLLVPGLSTHSIHVLRETLLEHLGYIPFFYLFIVYGFTLIIYSLHEFAVKKTDSPSQIFLESLRRYPAALVTFTLYILITFIGGCLFFIPGVFLSVLFSLSLPLVVIDKMGPFKAFKQSARLIQNNWWWSFGILALVLVIFYFFGALIYQSTSDLWVLTHNVTQREIWVLHNILMVILSILAYPLFCATLVVLLAELKTRKAMILSNTSPTTI